MTTGDWSTFQWDLQLEYPAGTYNSLISDVEAVSPLVASWGIRGNRPVDRVADTGTLTFVLNNSNRNSAATQGFYSPDHASCKAGWGIGSPLRLTLYDHLYQRHKRFYVTDIAPMPGVLRGRSVMVTACDYMGKMADQYSSDVTVQTNKRVDQALTTIVALLPVAPKATSYATGVDTLSYVFHDLNSRKASILSAIQRLVQSDLGYVFADMDDVSTSGEDLSYQTRHTRVTKTSIATLTNAFTEVPIARSDKALLNSLAVVSHPVEVGTDTEVLYTLQREQSIGAGGTLSFRASYRDPNQTSQSIRLSPGTEVTPVAGTDYKMSSVAGDNGQDLNAYLSVTVTWYGDNAQIELENTGSSSGYVNLLQLRGKAIRLYEPAESLAVAGAANLAAYGERTLRFSLPYQDNPNTAKDFAEHLLGKYGSPWTAIEMVEFVINSNTTLGWFLDGFIGEKFLLTETMSGLASSEWHINGIEIEISSKKYVKVRWFAEPASAGQFWVLGTAGFSELGDTTILGF